MSRDMARDLLRSKRDLENLEENVARSDRASASPSQRANSSERTHSSKGASSWVPSTLGDDAVSSRSPGKGDSSYKRTRASERTHSSERIHSRERTRASALSEEEDARCERRVRVPPLQEEVEEEEDDDDDDEEEEEEETVMEKEGVRAAHTGGGRGGGGDDTHLPNFETLGTAASARAGGGVRGVADVTLERLKHCILVVQREFGYQENDMPTLSHVRQAGFSTEALAVTYTFGGRSSLAARLGLQLVPEDVASSRFAEWGVVEKAVRRAATALMVQEQRCLIARREFGGRRRHTQSARRSEEDAQTVERGGGGRWGGGRQAAQSLRMPTGTQLRAQGMEQVDRAIRELHGGYVTVAHKLGLEPPHTQGVHRRGGVAVEERWETPSRSPQRHTLEDANEGGAGVSGGGRGGGKSRGPAPRPLWGGRAYESSIPASILRKSSM